MSKVQLAQKIYDSNPGMERKDLIGKFMSELNMSKAGATTYYYNLTKGQAKTPKAKVVKTRTVVTKPKQSKEDRLALIKDVAAKTRQAAVKKLEQDREEMSEEINSYLNEAEQYVKEHAPKFIRQELGLM